MYPHQESHRPPPRGPTPWLGLLLLAAVGLLAWQILRPRPSPLLDPGATARTVTARGALAEFEQTTIGVFQRAAPAVVNVANVALRTDRWSMNLYQIPQGTGSGFVWDDRGYVVTNEHVVRGGNRFFVKFGDGTSERAYLVGASPEHDLAVLKLEEVPAGGVRPLDVGTAADLQVGQAVFAIGNPFGLDHSLTTGIVSGLDREIRTDGGQRIEGVIQTDAAINPGNSGGPLLDSAGRVVGVNTAIVSPSGAWSGIGFAVPVEIVNRVVPSLIRGEQPQRPGLGIQLMPSPWLPPGVEGAGVLKVFPGSAAQEAGLKAMEQDPRTGRHRLGDVIVGVGDAVIRTREDLFDALQKRRVGETVRITVLRDGSRVEVDVTLQALGAD